MQPYLRKLRRLKRSKPSDVEESVAKTLFELETSHKTLRQELPRFNINGVRVVEVPRSKKSAMVIFYPLRFLMLVRKVQRTLTSELEKRHPGCAAQDHEAPDGHLQAPEGAALQDEHGGVREHPE